MISPRKINESNLNAILRLSANKSPVDLNKVRNLKSSKPGGMFSQSKRSTIFDKAVERSAQVPGPAEYKPRELKKGGPSFGTRLRPDKVKDTPGPGAYNSLIALGKRP